jgi:hypothetical protein
MLLEGSCRCGAVRFTVESKTVYPYMRCYCAICRKTDGGGGYAINIMGEARTLKVKGRASITVWRAPLHETEDGEGKPAGRKLSPARRYFCKQCGSALWVFDPRWAHLVHPFASAIDTKLPVPPERVHIMLDFAPSWVRVPKGRRERRFPRYPGESIENWHRRHGLYGKP